MNDLRFAFRQLGKSPGFAFIAIATLALGIGLNTSMFSLMNVLVLRPIPYPDRDHLVRVHRTTQQTQTAQHTVPAFLELERATAEFINLAAYRVWGFTLSEPGRTPENLNGLRVSLEFFATLGMQPLLGRTFTADEDQPGNHVVILSFEAWLAHFGGDPEVINRVVSIDGEGTTVVGVMPEEFSSLFLWGPGDVFRPLALTEAEKINRDDAGLQLIGRFHTDTSLAQLNSRLATIATRLAETRKLAQSDDGLRAVTLQDSAANPQTTIIMAMMVGLAGFVLLIACGNLANLQLARAVARAREFAIRAALGASRSHLLRPLLAESMLLALMGGALGILVAAWTNQWITQRLFADFPVKLEFPLDWRVITFACVVSLATGVFFGLVPAWLSSRVQVNSMLKSGARGTTGDRSQHRFRSILIVLQFALALVVMASAGFFIRGLNQLLNRDPGWTTRGIMQCVLNLPQARYASPEQTYAFYTQLQERIRAAPGVEDVAIGWTIPLFQFLVSRNYVVEGRDPPPSGREPLAFVNGVTPTFLETLKVRLVAGRTFSENDGPGAPRVVLINESFARALFPGEDAVGRRIGGTDPNNRNWAEIVGVFTDIGMAANPAPPTTPYQLFNPLAQETWNYVTVMVRGANPMALADPLRRAVGELDANIPVQMLNTADEMIRIFSRGMELLSQILMASGALGLFLAALGLYGVISRLVTQRTPEIGVRLALGAQFRDVVWLVLGSGLRLILIGTGIGLVLSTLIGFGLQAAMPGASFGFDLVTLPIVTVILLLVALLASYLPARRASKVNPLVALRAE